MPRHQRDSRAEVEFISEMRAWHAFAGRHSSVVRFGGRSLPYVDRWIANASRPLWIGHTYLGRAVKNKPRRTALSEEREGVYLLYSLGARVRSPQ